jgi:hypothetical protein
LHPQGSGELIVHPLIQLELLEDPPLNFVFIDIAFDDIDSIGEVAIYLFLGEPHVVRVAWVTIHVTIVLHIIIVF